VLTNFIKAVTKSPLLICVITKIKKHTLVMRGLRITQSTPFVSVGEIFRKVGLLPAVLLLFFLAWVLSEMLALPLEAIIRS